MNKNKAKGKLKPLAISCGSSNCANNLHCFKVSKKKSKHEKGKCQSCGVDLIDWERVYQRKITDAKNTFKSLKSELIRHHYWHEPIDIRAQNYARRKGLVNLEIALQKRMKSAIGAAHPFRDGSQTPWNGNIIYYAQHATACCCRKCIEYWHNIPMGIELTEEQIKYFKELALLYIKEKMPNLGELGEKVPPIKKAKAEIE